MRLLKTVVGMATAHLVSSTAKLEATVTARTEQQQVPLGRSSGRAREKMAHSRGLKQLWSSAALQIEPRNSGASICGFHGLALLPPALHRLSASESLFAVAELPDMAIGGLSTPREEPKNTGRPHKAARRR